MSPLLFGQLFHVAPLNFVGRHNNEGGNGLVQKHNRRWIIWYQIHIAWTGWSRRMSIVYKTSASIHSRQLHATARRTNGTDVSRPSIVSCTITPTSATVKSINTTTKTNYFPSGYTTHHHSKPSLEHILWLLSQPTDGTFTWRKIQAEGMVEDWRGRIQWIRKATKKREMKSHLDELESNKLVRIKS